jgi:hypothetical protein
MRNLRTRTRPRIAYQLVLPSRGEHFPHPDEATKIGAGGCREADEIISRAALGKDVTILRDRTGGESTPITLTAFRERLEREPTLFDADDEGACGCFMETPA